MASQGRHTVMSPYQILPSSWKNPIRINRFKWHANICDALMTGGSEEVTLTIVQMETNKLRTLRRKVPGHVRF